MTRIGSSTGQNRILNGRVWLNVGIPFEVQPKEAQNLREKLHFG